MNRIIRSCSLASLGEGWAGATVYKPFACEGLLCKPKAHPGPAGSGLEWVNANPALLTVTHPATMTVEATPFILPRSTEGPTGPRCDSPY
jgi:hypothetical protein